MRYWGMLIQIATATVGLLFPAYKSIEALESAGILDDSQWLTYWLLYALITVFERYTFGLLHYIPFFAELRLALLVFLALPPMSGAAGLYRIARPQLLKVFHAVEMNVAAAQGKPEPTSESDELASTRTRITDVKTRVASDLTRKYSAVATGKEKRSLLDDCLSQYESLLPPIGGVSSSDTATAGLEDSAHGALE